MFKRVLIRARSDKPIPSIDVFQSSEEGQTVVPDDEENQDNHAHGRSCHVNGIKRTRVREDDFDVVLVNSIVSNKRFKDNLEEDEYEFREKTQKPDRFQPQESQSTHIDTRCNLCYGNEGFRKYHKNCVIAESTNVYLYLEDYKPILPSQMVIVPKNHVGSLLGSRKQVQDEVRNFQKSLVRFFLPMRQVPIFVEVAEHAGSRRKHTRVHVFPIPEQLLERAKAFFIHSLRSLCDQLSSNTNAVIECKEKTDVSHSDIPLSSSYIHVELALQFGYVHVLDFDPADKRNISKFGRETIAGIMKLDDLAVAKVESVTTVINTFMKYDWTRNN